MQALFTVAGEVRHALKSKTPLHMVRADVAVGSHACIKKGNTAQHGTCRCDRGKSRKSKTQLNTVRADVTVGSHACIKK